MEKRSRWITAGFVLLATSCTFLISWKAISLNLFIDGHIKSCCSFLRRALHAKWQIRFPCIRLEIKNICRWILDLRKTWRREYQKCYPKKWSY
eukprot:754281-Hanusia_phi.AAC.1